MGHWTWLKHQRWWVSWPFNQGVVIPEIWCWVLMWIWRDVPFLQLTWRMIIGYDGFFVDCGMLDLEMDHQKFRVDQQMTGWPSKMGDSRVKRLGIWLDWWILVIFIGSRQKNRISWKLMDSELIFCKIIIMSMYIVSPEFFWVGQITMVYHISKVISKIESITPTPINQSCKLVCCWNMLIHQQVNIESALIFQ